MTTDESSELPNFPTNNPHHHHNPHLFEWLDETIPSFLEEVDPYSFSTDLTAYDWWAPPHDHLPDPLLSASPVGPTPAASSDAAAADPQPPPVLIPKLQTSKKRKLTCDRRRNSNNNDNADEGNNSSDSEMPKKPPAATSGRKAKNGGGGGNSDKGNKEVRWAEQILNPLASAIEISNLSRVQHLLYVLQELASPTGDANHRLAAHGYRALTRRLPAAASAGDQLPAPTFSAAEPKLFRSALIKFHEVSPWFAFPNSLANASILQTLTLTQGPSDLHVIDVGVSHGIQWPTLLEALTRRPSGAPPLVRLTVAGESLPPGPFSAAPPGYDFPSPLLRYAKSIELNLQIDKIADLASLPRSGDETLVVCAQFRVHHGDSDQRSAFLKVIRELDPDLLILTEIDGGGGGEREGSGLGFASEFTKRSEILWRFLDSTSAAFKGRDCVERRVMEGEMARVLEGGEGFGEGREKWRENVLGLGFREIGFGEEAVEAGRALLRKYDGNWEMRLTEAAVGLWWKGQPVSFCSIWKTANGKI